MVPSLQFSVPADPRYRVLGPEVAAKYAALAGCSALDVQGVLAEVDRAAADVAVAGEDIQMLLGVTADELLISMTCVGKRAEVRRALSAGQ